MIASPGGKLSAQLTEEECRKTAWRFLLRWNLLLRSGEHVWTEWVILRFRPHSSPGSFGPTLPPGEGICGAWVERTVEDAGPYMGGVRGALGNGSFGCALRRAQDDNSKFGTVVAGASCPPYGANSSARSG